MNLGNKILKRICTVLLMNIILCSTCFTFGSEKSQKIPYSLKAIHLKCDYATNPIGIDNLSPQFSWQIQAEKRGVIQKAYQIRVADSLKDLFSENVMWDSGIINSSKSVGVTYHGLKLDSRKRYYWSVKVWRPDNMESEWSQPAYFEMGLLDEEDWNADWVSSGPNWIGRVKYFRNILYLGKEVEKARFYISGIGYYELSINGEKVGDHVLDPGVTSYDKRVLYTTYDVTGFLKNLNVIGVTVASGWYGSEKIRGQLEITFSDGTNQEIITSSSTGWSASIGPIIQSSTFDGEIYDAREEQPGWNSEVKISTDVDRANSWTNVMTADPPGGKMVAQKLEPIKVIETIIPEIVSEPKKGIYVFDAGRNLAGWASLKVTGERGAKISLKFAETLYEDGTVNQENLRSAKAEDTYILKGEGAEDWEPAFTYHGFRFIQIEGFPYQPKPGDITVKVIRSAVNQVGKFRCSNELLNRIHQMIVNTEASNLHSIPTDCPQRNERMGWLNDMTVRIDQALYNFDLSKFYAKWIDDIGDTQSKVGSIADTAPFRWGFNPADPVSASYLLLALQSYNFYGNKQIVEKHYHGLKAWVDYLQSRTNNGIVDYSRWGDWSPPIEFSENGGAKSKDTPGFLISTGYLYYCSKIISKMAELLEIETDASYYEDLAKTTADAYNRDYWNEELGGYASNNQACNSFSLFIKIVPEDKIPRVVSSLIENVKKHDFHLTTGNLCTKYLLEMLTVYGCHELAYKIVSQESYPSWGYMLDNGATTLWERWEYATGGAMNSHNHPMMGSVDSWFYKYIVGIIPNIDNPGFENFIIHPYQFNELMFAEGEFNSVKGLIKSSWKKDNEYFSLNVTIPENSEATVFIPTSNIKSITEGSQKITKIESIKYLRKEGVYAVYRVGSGTYQFKSKYLKYSL